jgi:hypothetical protein
LWIYTFLNYCKNMKTSAVDSFFSRLMKKCVFKFAIHKYCE